MKHVTQFIGLVLLFAVLQPSQAAVHINPNGHGQVLIYPYYTVRNGFNSAYSIINTTGEAKALKLVFFEAEEGLDLLNLNLYLGPYDTWTGLLSPTNSTVAPHVGEPTAVHQTADQSCASFLNKAGQEFLPFSMPPGANFARSTEGFVVVIEMARITGASAAAIAHDGSGTPTNCQSLESAWQGGYWENDPTVDTLPPSGGLTGNMSLLQIAEGLAMSHPAVALDEFWQDEGFHGEPGIVLPDLSMANTTATLVFDQGLESTDWLTGYEAVSAALMSHSLINHYDLNANLAGRTEWVVNFPTKAFHTASELAQNRPFSGFGDQLCESLTIESRDMNTQPSPVQSLALCASVGVIEFIASDQTPGSQPSLFDSRYAVAAATFEASSSPMGWSQLLTNGGSQAMPADNGRVVMGLPMIGFQASQYNNSNAGPGILAQYASVVPFTSQRQVTDDLIFKDLFE